MSQVELQVTTQGNSCCINIHKNKVFFKVFCWFNWYKSHQKPHSDILQSKCTQNVLNTCNFCRHFRYLFGKLLASLSKTGSPSPTMKGEKQSCKKEQPIVWFQVPLPKDVSYLNWCIACVFFLYYSWLSFYHSVKMPQLLTEEENQCKDLKMCASDSSALVLIIISTHKLKHGCKAGELRQKEMQYSRSIWTNWLYFCDTCCWKHPEVTYDGLSSLGKQNIKSQTTQTTNTRKTSSQKDRDLQKDLRVQATSFQWK